MQTVITYYKDLIRWDVKYFISNLYFGDNLVALRYFLTPRAEKIKKDDYKGSLDIVEKITFSNGVVHFRDERKTGMDLFKGYKGDLLTSKINIHQGAVAICPQDLVCSTHYYLYQIDDKKIIPEYLILVLRSDYFLQKIIKLKSSSIKNETGPKVFLDFKIYAPSINEQQKIVDFWHKAQKEAQELNKKADEKEKAIDDYILRELGVEKSSFQRKQGTFIVWFKNIERWDTYFNSQQKLLEQLNKGKFKIQTLKSACIYLDYGLMPLQDYAKNANDGIPYIRVTNITKEGYFNFSDIKYIPKEVKYSEGDKVKENDILLVQAGGTTGKTAIVPKVIEGYLAASFMFVIRLNNLVALPKYIFYLLQSSIFTEQVKANLLLNKSTRLYITKPIVENLKIPLPPLAKQKEIAKKVETIRAEISEIKNKASGILETTQKEIGKILKA